MFLLAHTCKSCSLAEWSILSEIGSFNLLTAVDVIYFIDCFRALTASKMSLQFTGISCYLSVLLSSSQMLCTMIALPYIDVVCSLIEHRWQITGLL